MAKSDFDRRIKDRRIKSRFLQRRNEMGIVEISEIRKASDEAPCEILKAATGPTASFSTLMRRRQLLGAAGTIAAGAAAATLLSTNAAHAWPVFTEYLNILATGEALFVTFYSQAVAHHKDLGIHGDALTALKAILTEEQIHYDFATDNGGKPATTHFSFPHGHDTFKQRSFFLQTQQLSEELTNGALLAWIKDWAAMGQPRLAQIGGQLMQVEGGHRVVGRVIMDADPWDDWGFGPVASELKSFLDVPTVVRNHGFLTPVPGNDFEFHPVSESFPGVINTNPGPL
jgi:hypothetical protein